MGRKFTELQIMCIETARRGRVKRMRGYHRDMVAENHFGVRTIDSLVRRGILKHGKYWNSYILA